MALRKGLKNLLGRCFVAGGGHALGRRLHARRLIVLYYHRVVADDQPIDDNLPGMFVRASAFTRQVELLSNHYHPIAAGELLAALQGQPLPDHSVLITFDDGYRDNLTVAAPILARHGVPWLLFPTTGFLDNELTPWFDTLFLLCQTRPELVVDGERLGCQGVATSSGRAVHRQLFRRLAAMAEAERQAWLAAQLRAHGLRRQELCSDLFCRWSELQALPPAVAFGGHTRSHPCLARLNEQDACAEIVAARSRLADRLGQPITLFAYPTGRRQDFTAQTVAILKRHHFAAAFTTQYGLVDPMATTNDGRFLLSRIGIDVYDSLAAFKMKLAGGWRWFAR